MNPAIAALGPLFCALMFSGAVVIVWRRRRACAHARTWSAALASIAFGWMVVEIEWLIGVRANFGPVAPRLCWLGAALLIVQGLRERGQRRQLGNILAAIWIAVALASTLMLSIGDTGLLPAMSLVLLAIGGGVAAVAVGPRAMLSVPPRRIWLDWVATASLAGLAAAALLGALLVSLGAGPRPERALVALLATQGVIVLGLLLLLVLHADLVTALERLARIDPLTRIWNRRGFDEAARHMLASRPARFGPVGAVAIADIDAFKGVNDRFGHAAGDAVLVRFAKILKLAVGERDLLARLGGEEFALLALDCDGSTLLGRIERVRAAMAEPGASLAPQLPITASFGVAELNASEGALRDALERADKALYRAKSEGRDRAILSDTGSFG